jgi:hypothetical protein
MPTPVLDARSFEDILRQLRESAQHHMPEWSPGDTADPGVMLQHTFGRLMEIVIERLNQVPEKQLLAFLDALGISPLPPVPARAPLVFSLRKEADSALVPQGTAVIAKKAGGGPPPLFETVENLTVLRAAITCAYACQPSRSRYGDYTCRLNGGGFAPFIGERLMPDTYYFVDDIALSIEKPAQTYLMLNFGYEVDDAVIKRFLDNLKWGYSGGAAAFKPKVVENKGGVLKLVINEHELQTPLIVPMPTGQLGGGCEPPAGRYIKCGLAHSFEAKRAAADMPIRSAKIEVWGRKRLPEHLFRNNTRLDPDAYFLPFGNRPKEGDSFYIHMGDLFDRPGANVFLNMDVSSGMVGYYQRWCRLNWFYSTEEGWEEIKIAENESSFNGSDLVLAFTCPANAAPRKVGGAKGCWLRAVLPQGNYGCEAEYELRGSTYILKSGTGTFYFPEVRSISLHTKCQVFCRAYRQRGHIYTDIKDAAPLPADYPELKGSYFYVGFDNFFPHRPVSLYADAEAAADTTFATDTSPVWEFLAEGGWQPLYVKDDTAGLNRSGAVRFLTPPEADKATLFDNTARYWIRIAAGGAGRLKGLYLNAVLAEQATTVGRETLGAVNGQPWQRYTLRNNPVLNGQRLWVREAEAPTAAESAATEVDLRQNPVTLEQEYWVLWHEQSSFGASLANSRHYTLDRVSGEIRFGDGSRGMIPIKGSAIAVEYRYGGGIQGNLPADAIAKPAANLAGIELVGNPIAATGGAEPEDAASIRSRGPMALRHRGRGVTAQDLEWLVKEVGGAAIDRIKCLPADDKLAFTLMLLPAVEGARPLPDGNLAALVRDYLTRRIPAVWGGGSGFGIIGPRYVTVGVKAKLIPADPFESSQVRDRAGATLANCLHPRLGGPDGKGWPFGRSVYLSEICAVLEGAAGAGRALAGTVSIHPAAAQRELALLKSDIHLEVHYPVGSLLSISGANGRITEQWLLAEAINSDVLPSAIRVNGLREGDLLNITCPLSYSTASGGFTSYPLIDFPAGSPVRFEDGFTTVLLRDLPENSRLTGDMLENTKTGDGAPRLKDNAVITIIHPDTLLVRDLWDEIDGAYTILAACQCEAVPLAAGVVLECAQSKAKALLQKSTQEGFEVKLQFAAIKARTVANLTLAEVASGGLPLEISGARPITDTAYLTGHELCTPGHIEIDIVNQAGLKEG